MKFVKMQCLKNDYVLIDCFRETILNPNSLAVKISDRRSGVGGDGLVFITPSKVADAGVIIFNADGSAIEACGNGLMCAARYLYDEKIVYKKQFKVETESGIKEVEIIPVNGVIINVSVGMGVVDFSPVKSKLKPSTPVIMRPFIFEGKRLFLTVLSVANPHAVVLAYNIKDLDVFAVKDFIRNFDLFIGEVNFEFFEICNAHRINMRVVERGNGETYACGTGAIAVCATAELLAGVDLVKGVSVNTKCGSITVNKRGENYMLTGVAEYCFKGEFKG